MHWDVRDAVAGDRAWMRNLLLERWAGTRVVSRGRLHDAAALPALVAWYADERAGLLTYAVETDACEIVTLDACVAGQGTGSALLRALVERARTNGWRRVWLVTTNDNTRALRFYQRTGFAVVAVHQDAVTGSRRLKPEIPLRGCDGVPIRDEIELELDWR